MRTGDTVGYSKKFLRRILKLKSIPTLSDTTGVITNVRNIGKFVLADVEWNNHPFGNASAVNVKNLVRR